jgi:predicted methyltransferase
MATSPTRTPAHASFKAAAQPATKVLATVTTKGVAVYVPIDRDALRADKEQLKADRAASRQRQGRFTLKEGKNVIRILPGKGVPNPFFTTYIHYIRSSAPGAKGRPVLCPLKTRRGTKCFACAAASALYATRLDVDKKEANNIRASRRVLANVIDMADVKAGVQVLEFGTKIYDELLSILVGDDTRPDEFPGVDYTHPQNGFTLVIDKEVTVKGDPLSTKYSSPLLAQKPTPIPIADWQEKLFDLSATVEFLSDDRIQAIMEGNEEAEEASPAKGSGSVDDDLYSTGT